MKKLIYLIVLALILGLVLTGCLLSNVGQVPTSEQSGITYLTKGVPVTPSVNLVGLWHFDEGGGVATVADSSGHGNDGNVYEATTGVSGKFDNALSFDGVDDYVDFGSDTSLELTDEFTIELWVKRTDNATFERFLSHSIDASTYAYEVGVDYLNPDQWRLRLNSDDVTLKVAMTGQAGQWIHVAFVYDKSLISDNMKIYENGALVASGDYNESLAGHGTLLTNRQGKNDGWLNSTIDEVRIWNKALSGDDIGESYSLGAIEFTKDLTEVFLSRDPEPDPDDWMDWVVGGIPQVSIDTPVTFTMLITVDNQSFLTLNDACAKDRLGAELEVVPYVGEPEDPFDESIGEATYYTKGKSKKVFIDWDFVVPLVAETTTPETLTIDAQTDINPGGGNKKHQEYTSPGTYELNSGATLTFYVTVADEDIYLVVTTDGLWVEAVGIESD